MWDHISPPVIIWYFLLLCIKFKLPTLRKRTPLSNLTESSSIFLNGFLELVLNPHNGYFEIKGASAILILSSASIKFKYSLLRVRPSNVLFPCKIPIHANISLQRTAQIPAKKWYLNRTLTHQWKKFVICMMEQSTDAFALPRVGRETTKVVWQRKFGNTCSGVWYRFGECFSYQREVS